MLKVADKRNLSIDNANTAQVELAAIPEVKTIAPRIDPLNRIIAMILSVIAGNTEALVELLKWNASLSPQQRLKESRQLIQRAESSPQLFEALANPLFEAFWQQQVPSWLIAIETRGVEQKEHRVYLQTQQQVKPFALIHSLWLYQRLTVTQDLVKYANIMAQDAMCNYYWSALRKHQYLTATLKNLVASEENLLRCNQIIGQIYSHATATAQYNLAPGHMLAMFACLIIANYMEQYPQLFATSDLQIYREQALYHLWFANCLQFNSSSEIHNAFKGASFTTALHHCAWFGADFQDIFHLAYFLGGKTVPEPAVLTANTVNPPSLVPQKSVDWDNFATQFGQKYAIDSARVEAIVEQARSDADSVIESLQQAQTAKQSQLTTYDEPPDHSKRFTHHARTLSPTRS